MQVSENTVLTKTLPPTGKSGRRCSVCAHPKLSAINALLADRNVSKRLIGVQFDLVPTSLQRHAQNHLPLTAKIAVKRRERKAGDSFLDGLERSISRMSKGVRFGMEAMESNEIEPELAFRMTPAFQAQQLKALELLGKATGRLDGDQARNAPAVIQVVYVDKSGAAVEAKAKAVDATVVKGSGELE